jgi:hypothetical protein
MIKKAQHEIWQKQTEYVLTSGLRRQLYSCVNVNFKRL